MPASYEDFINRLMTVMNGPVFNFVLWGGLALLSIALLLVGRTRWGQAKPLSKCVALSLFAHILFMGYAYGTRMAFAPPEPEQVETVKVNVVADDQQGVEEETEGQAVNPWDQLPTEAAIEPEIAPLEMVTAEHKEFDLKREGAAVAPPTMGETTVETPLPEGPQIIARAPTHLAELKTDVSPAEAKPAERAVAVRKAPAPVLQPVAPLLPRSRPRITEPQPLRPDVKPVPSKALASATANMQRIADAAIAPSADIQADREDHLEAGIAAGMTVKRPEFEPAPERVDGSPQVTQRLTTSSAPNTGFVSLPRSPRRLGDGDALPDVYQLRMAPQKVKIAEVFGGSARTEAAVESALAWLAANQEAGGNWGAQRHGAGNGERVIDVDRYAPGVRADNGITGLALLAFLGAGHTHMEGKYKNNVRRAVEFLIRTQKSNGNLSGNAQIHASMYCHGMATLALSEAYAMTGDQILHRAVRDGIAYTVNSQNAYNGGWRYQPSDAGDMSQFGWQAMALRSAALAGIKIPDRTKSQARKFFNTVATGQHGGLASYRVDDEVSRVMTAEALACRFFLQLDRNEAAEQEAARYISQELPSTGKPNLYYWYYATIGMFQLQGPQWNAWNTALKTQLLARQETTGGMAGSWGTDTEWGKHGGRVYTTALSTLCLEVYYRYLPVYGGKVAGKPVIYTPRR